MSRLDCMFAKSASALAMAASVEPTSSASWRATAASYCAVAEANPACELATLLLLGLLKSSSRACIRATCASAAATCWVIVSIKSLSLGVQVCVPSAFSSQSATIIHVLWADSCASSASSKLACADKISDSLTSFVALRLPEDAHICACAALTAASEAAISSAVAPLMALSNRACALSTCACAAAMAAADAPSNPLSKLAWAMATSA